MNAIVTTFKDAQIRGHIDGQTMFFNFVSMVSKQHHALPHVVRARLEDCKNYGAYNDPKGAAVKVLGYTGMEMLLKRASEPGLRFKEGCLASVDAGPDGIAKLDHTFAQTKKVRGADGERAFQSMLNISNGQNEPMASFATQGTSLLEVKHHLKRLRQNIINMAGTVSVVKPIPWGKFAAFGLWNAALSNPECSCRSCLLSAKCRPRPASAGRQRGPRVAEVACRRHPQSQRPS